MKAKLLVPASLVVVSLAILMVAFANGSLVEPVHAGPSCVPPPSGLVSWWPGDGDATDIQDGNDGTLLGGAAFLPGKVGQAFSLDGVDDHVFIGDPANLKIAGSLTLDAWINPEDLTGGQIAAVVTKWGQSTALDSYWLGVLEQGDVIIVGGAIGVSGVADFGLIGGNIQPNTWSHIAMTYDSATGENILYANGQQVASRVRLGGTFVSNKNVLIGREDSSNTRHFPGRIDEVEIFDRVLSGSEIQAIFDAGSAGKCKGGEFAEFTATEVKVEFDASSNADTFELTGEFTLGDSSDGIDPLGEDVVVSVGTAEITIPAGSFTEDGGKFEFETELVQMELTGSGTFQFKVEASGLDLTGTTNVVDVSLAVDNDGGTTTVELEGELKFES